MLARPVGGNGQGGLEWYPPGRLVAWAAVLAALMVSIAILNFGFDAQSFRTALARSLTALLQVQSAGAPGAPLKLPGVSHPERLIAFMAEAIPPMAAVIAVITNTFNLWLAGRVVSFSGRLARPWPDLSAMWLPREFAMAMAVAVALSFAGGIVGIIAGVVSASLLMAYGILGFAVAHAVTRGIDARGIVLGARLCLGDGVRLADSGAVPAWPGRHDFRPARARGAPAHAANLRTTFFNHVHPDQDQGAKPMEVILLERVGKLGHMGDVVRVKDGFARNFLLPRGKALRATADNKKRFEEMKTELTARNLEAKGGAEKLAATLDGKIDHP